MSSFHAVLGSGSALATSLLARQGLAGSWSSSSSLSTSHRLCKNWRRLGSRGVVSTRAGLMERRCAVITGVARAHGIGRHLVYGFLEQVSHFFALRCLRSFHSGVSGFVHSRVSSM